MESRNEAGKTCYLTSLIIDLVFELGKKHIVCPMVNLNFSFRDLKRLLLLNAVPAWDLRLDCVFRGTHENDVVGQNIYRIAECVFNIHFLLIFKPQITHIVVLGNRVQFVLRQKGSWQKK